VQCRGEVKKMDGRDGDGRRKSRVRRTKYTSTSAYDATRKEGHREPRREMTANWWVGATLKSSGGSHYRCGRSLILSERVQSVKHAG
jgi:hypothetical protein